MRHEGLLLRAPPRQVLTVRGRQLPSLLQDLAVLLGQTQLGSSSEGFKETYVGYVGTGMFFVVFLVCLRLAVLLSRKKVHL